MEDWQDDSHWHDSEDCASETTMEVPIWCGVAGSSPSLNQQSKDKVKLMIDSGSQSTACSVDSAKGYATHDTEGAKLWDIRIKKLNHMARKLLM